SLEWATSCPPPRHNFDSIPRIRSERPAFDVNHPTAAAVSVQPSPDALSKVMGPADHGSDTLGGDRPREGHRSGEDGR
ncbi:cytochrome ubiquinol oxidase subunit I, partial [Luteipulveratus sp. YIM 133296]|nr:cytochrome ubiquinol oxidase subunit I [Luteipulveratus sp. YIM 133296]